MRANIHHDPDRGTGRTKRMVMDLPEGGCVVVAHNQGGLVYIRHMVGDLRGDDFLKSVRFTTLDCAENLRGIELPIFVDHFVHDYAWECRLRREYEILMEISKYNYFRRKS